jgi:hypothetical protein
MSVPNIRARLSAVLGREVQGYEKQADLLVELLEMIERERAAASQR